ncbi:putative cation efflux transmembrane domain superfamily [Helianthus anomalus]
MKRLVMLISLNVGCSTAELVIGMLSGQAGLVSESFRLTFGCGLLTFSLFAMVTSRRRYGKGMGGGAVVGMMVGRVVIMVEPLGMVVEVAGMVVVGVLSGWWCWWLFRGGGSWMVMLGFQWDGGGGDDAVVEVVVVVVVMWWWWMVVVVGCLERKSVCSL